MNKPDTSSVRRNNLHENATKAIKAVAVCFYERPDSSRLEEFILLINSAGVDSVELMSGAINRKVPATFITSGRLDRLSA